MLNPDGVIVGNYRTSLAGVDLNRVYKTPSAQLFPTVAAMRGMVDQLLTHRKASESSKQRTLGLVKPGRLSFVERLSSRRRCCVLCSKVTVLCI